MIRSPVAVVEMPFILNASPLIAIDILSSFTLRVFPDLSKPSPATICPAPENCVNVSAVEPTVIVPSVVNTYPLSAFAEPCSTKKNAPPEISAFASASVALVKT